MDTRVMGRPLNREAKMKTRGQLILTAEMDDILRINNYCIARKMTRSKLMVEAALKVIEGKAA